MKYINLEKLQGESELDYHKRIIYGKLVDRTLNDIDYTELSALVYGQTYSSDVARRMFYGSRRTLDLIENELFNKQTKDVLDEIDNKTIELRKERQKFYDQRNAFNQLVRERSRQEELNEIIVNTINQGNLPQLTYEPNTIQCSNNDLLVSLNDLHYGAAYSNYWGEYNSEIAKSMMQDYLSKIIDIAHTHNSENCYIWENGDAISGSIHRTIQITNKENVVAQIMGAAELIANFIAELSKHFKSVMFTSVAGNHSRIDPNKNNALLDERLDDLIEWFLEARLQNFDNVYIGFGKKINPTMYLMNIRGKYYCGIHGDFDDTSAKIQTLQTMAGKPLYAILLGHLHHNKVDEVQGIKTIMSGSFLGMDDYCVQKRIVGKPEQIVCVCTDDGVVCHYDISL